MKTTYEHVDGLPREFCPRPRNTQKHPSKQLDRHSGQSTIADMDLAPIRYRRSRKPSKSSRQEFLINNNERHWTKSGFSLRLLKKEERSTFNQKNVLSMDHAKEPNKGTTARELITVFSMNRRTLTPERGDSASRVNQPKSTKKQPDLITWKEVIGKR